MYYIPLYTLDDNGDVVDDVPKFGSYEYCNPKKREAPNAKFEKVVDDYVDYMDEH